MDNSAIIYYLFVQLNSYKDISVEMQGTKYGIERGAIVTYKIKYEGEILYAKTRIAHIYEEGVLSVADEIVNMLREE